MTNKIVRAMWLLNHSSARKFEIPMLKKAGISEIFLPKIVPNSFMYRSASVEYAEDSTLTIPKEDLKLLNNIDWYENPTVEAIDIANKYFDIVFFIATGPLIRMLSKHFKGAIILRAYGLDEHMTYSHVIDVATDGDGEQLIKSKRDKFWFGQVFENIYKVEPDFLVKNKVFLPLGTFEQKYNSTWNGSIKEILFVCPDIELNGYYRDVYAKFINDFKDFGYKIAGTQSIISHEDKNILGFVPREQHERNMREMRVMFYHSQEPRHLHYHPVEAIQAGMPLIYMGGGVLDDMAGTDLPGRCSSIEEARKKISRIMADDWKFINEVRDTQKIILKAISLERCEVAWKKSMKTILSSLSQDELIENFNKKKKIAIILPHVYRGGTLRAAKLVARAVHMGAKKSGVDLAVVFAYLDSGDEYSEADFEDLPSIIQKRAYQWRELPKDSAQRALIYAGKNTKLNEDKYFVPDDGVNNFLDCDTWFFISDRIPGTILPIRPYVCMVYDYLQRYESVVEKKWSEKFTAFARAARRVYVTTKFTKSDAEQFAGVSKEKIFLLPNLMSIRTEVPDVSRADSARMNYFVWVTNMGRHKNHENALEALNIYYEKFSGQLNCHVIGVNSDNILADTKDKNLSANVNVLGELSDSRYFEEISGAKFLWHPTRIDNGTYSVVEAASLRVPALSSNYPAMREINDQCNLSITWMDSNSPNLMAEKLKWMECNYEALKREIPSLEELQKNDSENFSADYWSALSDLI